MHSSIFRNRVSRVRGDGGKQHLSIQYTNEQIESITRNWVKRWVFDLNLCPWSGKVLADRSLKVVVSPSTQFEEIDQLFRQEAKQLIAQEKASQHQPPKEITTLIVLPFLTNYYTFLTICHQLERILLYSRHSNEEEKELGQFIQLANFHPEYQFQGTQSSDVENYTNRSPFPMIHLLRFQDVTKAIETYKGGEGNTDEIWKKNVEVMNLFGKKKIEQLQKQIIEEAIEKQ